MKITLLGSRIALLALLALPAQAMRYGFGAITQNDGSGANGLTGEAQIFVDVSILSADQVLFHFENNGPNASSLTHVYFDDQHMTGLLGIASLAGSDGVAFSQPADPAELPGGLTLITPFTTTFGPDTIAFSADSDEPIIANGVNPGEWLDVVFNFADSDTAQSADVLLALRSAKLRIGIHLQGFDSDINGFGLDLQSANSQPPLPGESFVNRPQALPISDASWTLLLLGAAMVSIESLRRRLQAPTS